MNLKYSVVPESKEMLIEQLGMSTQHKSPLEGAPTDQIKEKYYQNNSYRLLLIR